MTDGLLDTSVLIDLDDPAVAAGLPDRVATSSISLAELAAGPHLAHDSIERARRQTRLQQVESLFDVLDFDAASARSYGQVIAAVAHSNNLDLYTRNPQDFVGLQNLLTIVAV